MFQPIGPSIFESIFTIFTVTEDQDKLLLIQAIDNSWHFPRGRLQKKETIIEASSRIVLENTGVSTKANGIVQIIHASTSVFRKSISRLDFILRAEISDTTVLDINIKKVKSINWIDINEVDKLKLMDEDVVILEQYKSSRSKNNICSINLLDSKVL